jgi:hypothetical protein
MLVEMLRTGPIAIFVGLSTLFLWLVTPIGVDARRQRAKYGPEVAREMDRGIPPAGLRVIVKLRSRDLPARGASRRGRIRDRQNRVLRRLARGSYEMRRRHDHLSGFSLRVGRAALRALERNPEVELVYVDGTVHEHLTESGDMIGVTITTQQGFTGAGVSVAVLDTGIDTDHAWLMDDILVERCWCSGGGGCCPPSPPGSSTGSGAGSAEDDRGHGSAVSGIITSAWPAHPGVAPDAGIAALKVLDANGNGAFSDIDSALNWVLANHATYDIRVVNMSLGDGNSYSSENVFPCTGTVTVSAIDALTAAGVTVVVSSGNDAFTSGVTFPACAANAIAVGGVYDADVGPWIWRACTDSNSFPDKLVCHTNRSALLDVLAPDFVVDTTWHTGDWKSFSGTSAAAPFVAASAALLYAQDPALTPAAVRTLITSHGPLIPDPGAPADVWPRIAPAEVLTSAVFGPDTDADGISDDGDGSGLAGDDPCIDGNTLLCDDNCAFRANVGQDDPGGVGAGSLPNGIGTDCECGDLDLTGVVDGLDAGALRAKLADPNDPTLPPGFEDRCQLLTGGSGCGLVQAALLLRNVNDPPLGPPIAPVCSAATGL